LFGHNGLFRAGWHVRVLRGYYAGMIGMELLQLHCALTDEKRQLSHNDVHG